MMPTEADTHSYNEYRCECNRLLFRGILESACVEVKCKRCGHMNVFASGEGGEFSQEKYPDRNWKNEENAL